MRDDPQDQVSLGDWPAFGLQSDVRPVLAQAQAAGEAVAMVTLYAAQGPAPHGIGAQLLIATERAAGFLSGGCIEGDVAIHARKTLQDGVPRRLVYGSGGPPDLRLLCGTRIKLLVERMAADDPAARRIIALWRARRPALWLSDGGQRTCLEEGETALGLPDALRGAFARAVSTPQVSGSTEDDGAIFRRHDPQPRVLVAGGDPTALAIASLALQLGWAAAVIRPTGPEATPPIAGVSYLRGGDVVAALAALRLDPWTAVAVTSHDIEADGDVLAAALPSRAAYVGVLGSRSRIPERMERLRAAGVAESHLARLKAPIGLAIGAQTPWEIGVAVLGEMIAAFKADQSQRAWAPAPAKIVSA